MMPSQSDDGNRTGHGSESHNPEGGAPPKLSDQAMLPAGSPTGEGVETPERAPQRRDTIVGLSTARIETFSDAVFVIVSIFVVLQVQVPRIPAGAVAESLTRAILALWRALLSYRVTVVSVGSDWILYDFIFHYSRRSNRVLLCLNLLFLAFVSFLPFPTALLGVHVETTSHRDDLRPHPGGDRLHAFAHLGVCHEWP